MLFALLTLFAAFGSSLPSTLKGKIDKIVLPRTTRSSAALKMAPQVREDVGFTLQQENVECGSEDELVGNDLADVQACAEAVKQKGGEFFIYGKDNKAKKCYIEKTSDASCSEGFATDSYDFFQIEQKYDNLMAPPTEDLTVSIINKKFEFTRPVYKEDTKNDWLMFKSGSSQDKYELFRLKKVYGADNEWFIYNAASNKVVNCNSDNRLAMKGSDQLSESAKWKIKPAKPDGWYYMESIAHPGWYWAGDWSDKAYCWSPEHAHVCVDGLAGWQDGGCSKNTDCPKCQHGTYKSGKFRCCTYENLNDGSGCWCEKGEPINLRDADGNPDDRFKWRFEDLYASATMWHTVDYHENELGCAVQKIIEIEQGYNEMYESSSAKKWSMDYGVSANAGLSLEVANFGGSMEADLGVEVASSVSEAAQGHYNAKMTTNYVIAPHSCFKWQQVWITQTDTFQNLDMSFKAGSHERTTYCNTPALFWGEQDVTTCPPDHVIEVVDSDEDEDEVAEEEDVAISIAHEEEALAAMETVTFSRPTAATVVDETPYAVYGFAIIGLGAVLYGAVNHYSAKLGTAEETTPLEP